MKKRTIFIELTSLLDVILIMIFVLLTQARAQTTEAIEDAAADRAALKEVRRELKEEQAAAASREADLAAEIGSLESKAADLETQVEELGRQLITQDLVMDNSLVLTLSVAADTSIFLEVRDEESIRIPYDWADNTYAVNRLRSLLSEQLGQAGERTVFLVFQYDRTAIYHAEYDTILQIVQGAKLEASQKEILLSFIEMDVRE
ncbi:MAG: hypothetical protein J5496_06920 [Lachnospiraceae bacterium]|nr:hypothetical protein [Lachnospiraceae bacterium]